MLYGSGMQILDLKNCSILTKHVDRLHTDVPDLVENFEEAAK